MYLEVFIYKSVPEWQIQATVNTVAATINSFVTVNSVAAFSAEQKATLLTMASTKQLWYNYDAKYCYVTFEKRVNPSAPADQLCFFSC